MLPGFLSICLVIKAQKFHICVITWPKKLQKFKNGAVSNVAGFCVSNMCVQFPSFALVNSDPSLYLLHWGGVLCHKASLLLFREGGSRNVLLQHISILLHRRHWGIQFAPRIIPSICVVEVWGRTHGVFSRFLACQVNSVPSAGETLNTIASRGSCFHLWQRFSPGTGNRRVESAVLSTFRRFVPGSIWKGVTASPPLPSVSDATGCRSWSHF